MDIASLLQLNFIVLAVISISNNAVLTELLAKIWECGDTRQSDDQICCKQNPPVCQNYGETVKLIPDCLL